METARDAPEHVGALREQGCRLIEYTRFAIDRDALVLETLLAFKRAGCSGVLTYHALHAAKLLHG